MIEQTGVGLAMNCWPGVNAAAGMQEDPAGRPVLTLYLDTPVLVLQEPRFPGGDRVMARFCWQLSAAAAEMADRLDPEGKPCRPETTGPRHALIVPTYLRDSGGA